MTSALPSLLVCLIISHFILIFYVYKLSKFIDSEFAFIHRAYGLISEKLDDGLFALKLIKLNTDKED
jgi:hypothetical protein